MNRSQKFTLTSRRLSPASPTPSCTAPAVPPGPLVIDPIVAAMDQAAGDMPRLLTPQEVGEMLGLTERTLERWRIIGEGPRYAKLSRSTVRYSATDVAAFISVRLKANTSQ